MENFDWTSFTRRIAIKATLPVIYDAWTKAAEIEKWFLSDAAFSDPQGQPVDKTAGIQQGYSYAWQWYLFNETETGRVTAANGRDHLQFTFAGNCLVDVSLQVKDDHVLVELTQKNIPTDERSKKDIRLGCATGWSFFLLNLKAFYEGGLDLRNKNSNFKGMVNN